MKLKSKMIASIMSICLVCAVFAIGVFALKTANLKIGGDVSFTATGVEAHIKNASVTGAVTQTTLAANDSEGEVINTSMTQADIDTTFQNWQSLKLDFDEEATDIELKFDIANTSTNAGNYIEIDYSYSFSNSSPNVDVFPGDENDQSVWENNNYILAPKGSAETATYETFTLKFKVLNKELNVPQDTNVSVNIELKHVTPVDATTAGWTFTENAPAVGEATIKGFTGTLPENKIFEIPSVLKNGGNNYIVTKIYTAIGIDEDPNLNHFIPSDAIQLSIPNSIKELWGLGGGEAGDYSVLSLTNIIMPKSLSVIGAWAFVGCSKLTSVNIPYGVKTIREYAFDYCTGLTTVTIPSGVTTISGSAFSDTPWYNNQPDGLIYINNILYKYKGTMPAGTSIEVKEGTVSISGSAFSGCSNLTSITIPSSVTSISGSAFSNCTNLTSVKFEETTGWWYADSADATSGTDIAESEFTTDASLQNAKLLTETYRTKYWFRTAA